ncbi:MAG: transitional endoplasmic reticulum ATPase [archaeon GW2011_AR17]|nr:MAG: transitional endoplasmic reticulum ATPase [archaeon GW2011_AR17]MBS3154275.1 CDC48 family AAA ATPase [Candidatus Woesearchaeota archaeon]HIH14845.1 CDC48 family AAA ATPase [Nanoarchaeota archaeon]HIH58896.1 CDC48 family AAA ATPase [Nanoarchaeota archaeon]HII14014.1 CDC48 family AAA ATPase [Nanoarchaeota archaeon]
MEEFTMNEVTLKVMEALQEEAYKGVVRIDTETMRDIGVRIGDIVEIEGGRKTVGIVDRAYPTDIGQTVIRMDGILRRNAKTGIGEVVKVRRAAVKEAKTVTIAPAQKGVTIKVDPNMFKRGLLGRAVVKGDILALGGTRRRRSAMSDNPFFEDVFQMFEDDFMGGFGIAGLRFVVADGFPKSALVITEATDLKFSTKAVEVLEEKVPYITYEDIGGLTDEIEKVREMVELPLKHPELFERLGIEPPKGILLHGPPGCGKTLLAKAVANESDATFLLINGPEVVSKFVGEAEKKIREKFEEAEKKAPSILFIDEIDAIASKREESYGEVEKRMVAQLLATMDGMQERGKVIVIAATNRPNSIDPALRRPGRFDREIIIAPPSKEGRLNILKIHTRNMPLKPQIKKAYVERGIVKFTDKLNALIQKLDSKKIKVDGEQAVHAEIEEVKDYLTGLKDVYKLLKGDLKENEKVWETVPLLQREKLRPIFIEGMLSEFASRTHGFVGADLAALCKEAAINVIRRVLKKDISLKENQPLAKEVLDKLIILDKDFEEAMRIVIPSGMREVMVEVPNVGWDDIGGLEDIKMDLKEAVEWPLKYPQRFKDIGIRAPRGVLLYGPPGCGKTMLAKAVAHESEANFILVKGPELLNMWVGESEKGVREIFKKARQVAPTIIFFDEIDAIATRRGVSGNNVVERVVNTLLTEIDGLEELHNVVVIAATNRPDILDPALLRSGRFDRILLTPLPDEKARLEIFKLHTKNMPLAKDVHLKILIDKTVNYVGSDIEGVCREAGMLALRENIKAAEVSMDHFEKALDKVKASVRPEDMKRYQEIEESYIRTARGAEIHARTNYFG